MGGFLPPPPAPCHPGAPSAVIPAQAGIPCAAGMIPVTPRPGPRDLAFLFLSPRGPGPARRVAWVDIDRGAQVIRRRRAATQINIVCAGAQNSDSPGSRGQPAPHKNIRFCGAPAPRDDKREERRAVRPRRGMTKKTNTGYKTCGAMDPGLRRDDDKKHLRHGMTQEMPPTQQNNRATKNGAGPRFFTSCPAFRHPFGVWQVFLRVFRT